MSWFKGRYICHTDTDIAWNTYKLNLVFNVPQAIAVAKAVKAGLELGKSKVWITKNGVQLLP